MELPDDITLGQRMYDELQKSGALDGHDGEMVWIHVGCPREYAFGEGVTGMLELRAKVRDWCRRSGVSEHEGVVYSRCVGRDSFL